MSANLTKLRCPRCSKSLGIPRKLAGKTYPCPKCGVTFSIADDLTHLRPLAPPQEEEPITAEVAEPPLAMSVEKPEASRFPWLLVIFAGVTIVTLLIIGVVVMSLPSSSSGTPPTDQPASIESAVSGESETSEQVEAPSDTKEAESANEKGDADEAPEPDAPMTEPN